MKPIRFSDHASGRRAVVVDALFLAAAVGATAAFYAGRLGFYHDDYQFLGLLATAPDQSFSGLLETFRDGVPKQNLRPAQQVLFVGLYDLFGTDPLPWHLVGGVLLVGMAVSLYALLRELMLPRPLAIAIPLLWAVLPHYASARFWPATFAELLSMLTLFVSLLAFVRASRARLLRATLWLALAVCAFAVSVLAYEVAMPLFVLAPVLALYRRSKVGAPTLRRVAVVSAIYALALLAVFAWKVAEAREIGRVTGYDLGYPDGFAYHLAYLGQGILRVNAGSYGLGLPYVVGWILTQRLSWIGLAVAVGLGVASYAYLALVQRDRPSSLPNRTSALGLMLAGLVVVLFGYGVFLTNSEILFRSAGADNRVAIAAAMGIAIAAVGGVSWLATRFAGGRAEILFRALVAVLVSTGALAVNTLADYWAEAWTRQQQIVAELRSQLPRSPTDITVILDGTCPEIGPAVVFVSTTDLTGALKIAYREPSVQAAVVRDKLLLGREQARITNTFLGEVSSVLDYPYRPGLFVFNGSSGQLFPLGSAAEARSYRAQAPRPRTCPPVRSFAWGIDIRRWRLFA